MEYGVFLTEWKELEIAQDFLGVFFGSVPTGLLVLKNWRTCLISISGGIFQTENGIRERDRPLSIHDFPTTGLLVTRPCQLYYFFSLLYTSYLKGS